MKFRGWLLDVDYIVENDRPVIRMWCTDDEGRSAVIFDRTFEPYFYLVPYGDVPIASIENISDVVGGEIIKPVTVDIVDRKNFGDPVQCLQDIYATSAGRALPAGAGGEVRGRAGSRHPVRRPLHHRPAPHPNGRHRGGRRAGRGRICGDWHDLPAPERVRKRGRAGTQDHGLRLRDVQPSRHAQRKK